MSMQEQEDKRSRPPLDDALRERAIELVKELMDLLEGREPPPRPCGPQLRLLRGGRARSPRMLRHG